MASSTEEMLVRELFALTAEQHDEFARRGVLRLAGFHPACVIAVMREHVWSDLETRYAMDRGKPSSWVIETPADFIFGGGASFINGPITLMSVLWSVVGAVILLAVLRLVRGGYRRF